MKLPALILAICAALALAAAGCGGSDDSSSESTASSASTESSAPSESSGSAESTTAANKTKPKVTVPKGPPPKKLEIKELEEGTGPPAKAGDEITVQYVGVGYKSGEEFDSSWSRNEPFTFGLGSGLVIKGWEQGMEGMKVGGRRELIIPPALGYGASGTGSIGPNETLIFVIDLLAIK